MYIGYGMSKQDWKELLDKLRSTEGVTLTEYPETTNDGEFVDFKYVTFECNNQFFYMQEDALVFGGITITLYQKVSPYEKQQCAYPTKVSSFDEIMEYAHMSRVIRPFKDTHNQRIYLLELYGLRDGRTTLWRLANEWSGFREKDILANLDRIEMVRNSGGYKVLRFWHKDRKEFFDYECNSKRITG